MRFIHIADVHLGAEPDAGYPWSAERSADIWNTFHEIISDCGRLHVDLLLIAGDLFHHAPTMDQLREINYLFAGIPATRVVLIAGNHDYITPDSTYLQFDWNRNVVGLFSDKCECVRFPEINTEVYGFSYHRQIITEPVYDDLHPLQSRNFSILLAHGGDMQHIPVNAEKLARSGFDYTALGHIHKPEALVKNRVVFSGAPEPVTSSDLGEHGYILGEVERGRLRTQFVPRAKRMYRTVQIACTAEDTTYSLRDDMIRCMEENGKNDIYRFILTGTHRPGTVFDRRRLQECGHVLEVEDRTEPAWDLEEMRQRYHGQMIGRFIESFDGSENDETAQKALRYGLEALTAAVKDRGQMQ